MATITVSDDSGQLVMSMDGQEEVLESVEKACQAIEASFGMEQNEVEAMMSAQKGYGPKNERPTPEQVFGEGM